MRVTFPSQHLLVLLPSLFLLYSTATAAAVPAPYPAHLHPQTRDLANPHNKNHLHKRHEYTLICGTTSASGVQTDDIPLSRRCTAEPYKYRCDRNGQPDIVDGGRTLEECDRKCDCRNVNTDPKPRCIALGGSGGSYWCGVNGVS